MELELDLRERAPFGHALMAKRGTATGRNKTTDDVTRLCWIDLVYVRADRARQRKTGRRSLHKEGIVRITNTYSTEVTSVRVRRSTYYTRVTGLVVYGRCYF